jgi:hypothetical protein
MRGFSAATAVIPPPVSICSISIYTAMTWLFGMTSALWPGFARQTLLLGCQSFYEKSNHAAAGRTNIDQLAS